jgi:Glycosyl transferase family 2/Glycosyltransferase family 87
VRIVRVAGAVIAAAALAGLVLVSVRPAIRHRLGLNDVVVLAALWIIFAVGALLVRRIPVRQAAAVILVGGAAMQLAALSARPHTSDDVYRYIWDGRVQAAGIDPYRYVPSAPELVSMRDSYLWPTTSRWCVAPGSPDPDRPGTFLAPGCTKINRPTVHTIYPPVAEAYFLVVDESSPAGSGTLPMQGAAAVAAMAVTAALLTGLRRVGRDPRLAVLWAWCPTVAFETGNGAHVDVIAVALTVVALLVLSASRTRGRSALGGGLLGLAVATKVYPVLVAPAVARRRPITVASAAVAAMAAVYLPHVLAVGSGVLGFLPSYVQQEGYGNGTRFLLLSVVLPPAWCGPAAAVILTVTALAVMRFTDPRRPWDGAVVMAGIALLLTCPDYPWYAELLVAMAAMAGRAEWLPVSAAGYLPLFGTQIGFSWTTSVLTGYGTAAAVVAIAALARLALRLPATGTPQPREPQPREPQPREPQPRAAGSVPPAPNLPAGAPAPSAGVSVSLASARAPLASEPVSLPGAPGASGPLDGAPVPLDGAPVPLDGAPVPLDGAPGPLDGAPGPLDGAPGPLDGAPGPLDGASGPLDGASGPLDGAPVPLADVILPCLDEAAALPYVLGRLPAGYRAIVVDNGSSDGSAQIASRLGAQVIHEPRRGFGAACHAGLRAATADVVCFCDCDGSLDPAELPLVAGPVLAREADLVLGRRRPRSVRAWPPHARVANWLLARRIRSTTGTQIRDLGPMRAGRRESLLALGLRDRRFGYPLEMVLAAARANWRITEANVRYVPRTGKSKVTGTLSGTLRAVHDMREVWKAVAG